MTVGLNLVLLERVLVEFVIYRGVYEDAYNFREEDYS